MIKQTATGGPVSYLESNSDTPKTPADLKDAIDYDGIIEPLDIRSKITRSSTDPFFSAHDIRGELLSDVASDSRKRSNPISQFIDLNDTKFEPYEDGIQHFSSIPAINSYVKKPIFDGAGLNDLTIFGDYSSKDGTISKKFFIECVQGYSSSNEDSNTNDKFKWKVDSGSWSDTIELTSIESSDFKILTFDKLGNFGSVTSSYVSNTQVLNVPGGVTQYDIKIYAAGDINSEDEYYSLEYYDNSNEIWIPVNDNLEGELSGNPNIINSSTHPSGANTFDKFSSIPHWHYHWPWEDGVAEEIPLVSSGSLKFRIIASANVNRIEGIQNIVKINFEFQRKAAKLELSDGLVAFFDYRNGHTSKDQWTFEAVSKTHDDRVGSVPLPGYLTWQESKLNPFVDITKSTEIIDTINDVDFFSTYASATIAFNYPGYSGSTDNPDLTWEMVYISSLDAQAFTLTDSYGVSNRFEFDSDGLLENDGQTLVSLLRPEITYIKFPNADIQFQKRDDAGNLLWFDSDNNLFAAYSSASSPASGVGGKDYLDYDSGEFVGISQAEWAEFYNFSPANFTKDDTCPSLTSPIDYAGKYFIITDAVDAKKEYVNNTVKGGRYAVWFNVIDEDGNETAPPTYFTTGSDARIAPNATIYWDVDNTTYQTAEGLGWDPGGSVSEKDWSILTTGSDGFPYYNSAITKTATWSSDNGAIIRCAIPKFNDDILHGTGWNPEKITQTMSVDIDGNKLWTYDSGVSVTIAADAGWDGVVPPTETEWASANGYTVASLNEKQWHKYEGYEDYSDLIPQLIQVRVNSTDSIKKLVANTVNTIRTFTNKNLINVFDCIYIEPPEYLDYWDLDPADPENADELASGTWVTADYDSTLKVKLENDPFSFNQYAYDPTSPPVKKAVDAGWSRYYYTIKIISRNLGYHNITNRVDKNPHEPLFFNVPPYGSAEEDPFFFQLINNESTDWGGLKKFKELLEHTNEIINSSSLNISSSIVYSPEVGQLSFEEGGGDTIEVYVDPASTIDSGILLTDDNTGIPYTVFNSSDLISDVLVRYPTKLEHNVQIDGGTGKIQKLFYYYRRNFLCGLRLAQKTPGSQGNKKIQFHHYSPETKGNIVASDFVGGSDSGPRIENVINAMSPAIDDIRPHGYKSASAGMIYNDMPCGTDSITFGGWKK